MAGAARDVYFIQEGCPGRNIIAPVSGTRINCDRGILNHMSCNSGLEADGEFLQGVRAAGGSFLIARVLGTRPPKHAGRTMGSASNLQALAKSHHAVCAMNPRPPCPQRRLQHSHTAAGRGELATRSACLRFGARTSSTCCCCNCTHPRNNEGVRTYTVICDVQL